MTSITWAGPRCVQEAAAILGPQNRTQGRCELFLFSSNSDFDNLTMQSAKFQRKLIYGGVAGSARSPIGTQERLPRNFTSPLPTIKEL